MLGKFRLTGLILFLVAVLAAGCTCQDEAGEDEGGPDLPQVDDDTADDVVDDAADDTDDEDDTSEDDTTDDAETEYDSLFCDLPDPLGIAPNLIGGGPIEGTITVYAFSETCDPIENANVLHEGTVYQTDADGKALITVTRGEADQRVTCWVADKGAVSYKADAKSMYFFLGRKIDEWSDSEPADFLDGGDPLGLINPDITGVLPITEILGATAYAGAALPGLSRNTLLRFDFNHLFPAATFNFDLGPFGGETPLPAGIYLPDLSIEIGALGATFAGVNEQYVLPVNQDWEENPIEGVVASVSLTDVVTAELLGEIIQTLIDGGDVLDILIGLTGPLLTDGVAIEYVGVNPEWDGAGAPDLTVAAPDQDLEVRVANTTKSNDYLALALAEIPNRALLPMSLTMIESGVGALFTTDIPNADYLTFVVNANLEEIFYASDLGLTLSIAAKYAEDLEEWSEGVDFDATTDFLPGFDLNNTGYVYQGGEAGKIYWTLPGGATADMFGVIFDPACEGCPSVYATVPPDENAFVVPFAELGITLSEDDVATVIAGRMDGFDYSAFNPMTVFGEPFTSLAIWTNFQIMIQFP